MTGSSQEGYMRRASQSEVCMQFTGERYVPTSWFEDMVLKATYVKPVGDKTLVIRSYMVWVGEVQSALEHRIAGVVTHPWFHVEKGKMTPRQNNSCGVSVRKLE